LTKFDVQIIHGVEEIGQQAWDKLGKEQPFASYRWYRFGEKVLIKDRPTYVILWQAGEPVARATFWLTNQEPIGVGPRIIIDYLMPMILRRWPLLLCRSPLSSSPGLILPDDPQLRKTALETISQVGQELARKHRVSFVVFDYLERQVTEWPIWPAHFMPATIPEPGTHLVIKWPDFESYMSQLTRKRRKHYRQHLKREAEMGIEISLHPTVIDVDKSLALIRSVEAKYDEPPAYWEKSLLENAGMVDAVWIAAKIGERLVGCELLLGDRDHWRVIALGRDYDFDYVYFLLSYADIRFAIENGAKILHWGTCAYDVKRRLGFALESNHHLTFAANNRALRWMASKLAARLSWEPNG